MEMKHFRVLILDNLHEEGVKLLKNEPNFTVDVKSKLTEDELCEIIHEYDGVIIRSATKITSKVMEKAKKLKVIARAGTGYDNIDIQAANKNGTVVLITPQGNSNAVIELTIGLMINSARNIFTANYTMREGKWEKKKLKGTELLGKTVGIIGLGRIGAGVAKRCQAFGMEVIAYDRFIPKKRAEDLKVELVETLEELLKRADYITIHIPKTPETENLINKDNLKLMKPNAVIVNVARGGIVNEQDLYNALVNKQIRGACVDVYSKEPAAPSEFPFINLDNCLATPHLGASTVEAQIEVAKMAAEHMIQALNSSIFIDAVNISFQLSEELADLYRPFMQLGAAIGKFIGQYNPERIINATIKYKSEILTKIEPIKAVILRSLFKRRLIHTESLNYMNLDSIIEESGIKVSVEKYSKPVNFENYIKVYITTEDGKESKVAGTVFSNKPKIVEIDGMYFDFEPNKFMLVLKNKDVPGAVGKIGTLLGNKGINIASIQLGRLKNEETALSVIAIDEAIDSEDLAEIEKLDIILSAKGIVL